MKSSEKLLVWVGSSKKDLPSLPVDARKFFGHALDFAQRGERHDCAKVLKGFGGAGVLEVLEDDEGGTYRAVYTVKFKEAVFVLHCFQKKSKVGIGTPKEDMDIIHASSLSDLGRRKRKISRARPDFAGFAVSISRY